MIQRCVLQCNVRWLRLVRSCIMSCSWSDAAVALIILFSRERERQRERRKGSNRGSIEDEPGQPGPPVCTGPKQEEDGTNMGRNSILGGQGKRGRVLGPERENLRKREGKFEGDPPVWHRGRWISQLFPQSCLLPDFKDTVDRGWVIKQRANWLCASVEKQKAK